MAHGAAAVRRLVITHMVHSGYDGAIPILKAEMTILIRRSNPNARDAGEPAAVQTEDMGGAYHARPPFLVKTPAHTRQNNSTPDHRATCPSPPLGGVGRAEGFGESVRTLSPSSRFVGSRLGQTDAAGSGMRVCPKRVRCG